MSGDFFYLHYLLMKKVIVLPFLIYPMFSFSQTLNMRTSELDGIEQENIKNLVIDTVVFNETLHLRDRGVMRYEHPPWVGPCEDNPFRKQKFQSKYEVYKRFIVADKYLVFTIIINGGNSCYNEWTLLWDGVVEQDKNGNKTAYLILSFKNIDWIRDNRHMRLAVNLSSLPLQTGEKITLRIYGHEDEIE